jgi:hypothetical protein
MQRMRFCSGSKFLTGDRIAASLLHYVRAVAATHRSDVVTVPVILPGGGRGTVTLLLNQASQISAESVPLDDLELIDEAFVRGLDALTIELLSPVVWQGEEFPAA